jgi:PilY1 beta-propeller domain
MKNYLTIGIRAGVILALILVTSVGFADDSELFTTRANPDVLLVVDTSASMSTTDPLADPPVGTLAGGTGPNRRVDIIWKVLYGLLNADASAPSSSPSFIDTLDHGAVSGSDRIEVDKTSYDQFPSSAGGKVLLGKISTQELLDYVGKTTDTIGHKTHYYINVGQATVYDHLKKEPIGYYSSLFQPSYPQSNADATDPAYINNIDDHDMEVLGVRFGIMTYNSSVGGTIRAQINGATAPNDPPFTPSYRQIWQEVIAHVDTGASTPTTLALRNDVPVFFGNAYDLTAPCRKKFIVLLTDGEDTRGIGGETNTNPRYYYPKKGPPPGDQYSGYYNPFDPLPAYNNAAFWDGGTKNKFFPDAWENANTNIPGHQVQRNNWLIETGKILKDQGIELFVVGVGMSGDQQTTPHIVMWRDTLRRMAAQKNEQGTAEEWYNIATGYGGAVEDTTRDLDADGFHRAYFGTSADEVATALAKVFHSITAKTYAFTAPTVSTVRTSDKNYLYLAHFEPAPSPATFWEGHINAYTINTDNSVTHRWDGAAPASSSVPLSADASARRIYTAAYDNSATLPWSRIEFNTTNVLPIDLGVATTAERDSVVSYCRGDARVKKLGDIYHSKPVLVGGPSDKVFDEGFPAFAAAKKYRDRVLYAGANDGMLHAFHAGTYNSGTKTWSYGNGEELFGYAPYDVLTHLPDFVPTDVSGHGFYVDSSPRVADVWIDGYGGSLPDNVKQAAEWRTVLISGMRKGGGGYFALDVTDPQYVGSSGFPMVLWEYIDDSVVKESWSEPFIGKVRIKANSSAPSVDRFVAIVGAGPPELAGTAGKSVLVIDVATGNVLRQFTGINKGVAASPNAIIKDGYLTYVYVPDLYGNLWKFDLHNAAVATDGYSQWTAVKLFQPAAGGQPAFHRAEVAFTDLAGSAWYVYYGTGDQDFPVSNTGSGKFYAIKDDATMPGTPIIENSSTLADLTTSILAPGGGTPGPNGWVINLGALNSTIIPYDTYTHSGEKVLSDPIVFNKNVYFTTFTANTADPCEGAGIARVYGLNYLTAGSGVYADTIDEKAGGRTRVPYHVFGTKGLASSPVLSINPQGQSSVFVGFSDATFLEMGVDSPGQIKFLRSWQEKF